MNSNLSLLRFRMSIVPALLITSTVGLKPILVSAQQEDDAATATQQEKPLSLQPEHRKDQQWWAERHAQKLDEVAKAGTLECDVLLLGDSITHSWEGMMFRWPNAEIPQKSVFNLGFSGDRTEHVLWRLNDGAVDNVKPKTVMLMIGTNNTGHRMDSPEDIAAGIRQIVDELKQRLPESKILVLGVFPRGQSADDKGRLNNLAVNELISDIGDDSRVFFRDIGKAFFAEDGSLTNGVRDDFLHLNEDGYTIWAGKVVPLLKELIEQAEPSQGN